MRVFLFLEANGSQHETNLPAPILTGTLWRNPSGGVRISSKRMEETSWEAQRWLSVHWEDENLEAAQPARLGCLSSTNLAWKAWNIHGEYMFEGQGI